MKILLVNNYYYNRGGDCTYLFSLKKLLEEKGHEVVVFSMHHPKNFDSEYSKYFVSYINYDDMVKEMSILSGFRVLNRTVYSKEAKQKINLLINDEKPDIAHLQNIHHHITPSIIYSLKKCGIPVVWTLHDYTVICPNTSLLSHDEICEKCKKVKYFWPPITKCKKNSFGASAIAAFETAIHRILKINKLVDVFIAPSEFLKNKLLEYEFMEKNIICLNNFNNIDLTDDVNYSGDYYLYIGRISSEKGIRKLIDAAVKTNSGKLKIVGDGPLKKEMMTYVKFKNGDHRIEFLGHKSHGEVIELIKNCQFVVIPSEWYENYPFAIIETFACGKPAIGSRVGGIPELIKDTERGLIFEMGDTDDLCSTIKYLLNNPDLVQEMGKNAKDFVTRELSAEMHYKKLLEIYERVVSKIHVTVS